MSRQRSAWSRIRRGIFAQFRALFQLVDHFATDQLDRGQRRAQFMRRGGHHAAEVGQLLFAGQRHLGGQQRLGHRLDLGADPAGIDADETRLAMTMATQIAEARTVAAVRGSSPVACRSGRWNQAISVTSAMAAAPITRVERSDSAVAATVTGARISSAKGLLSPPVRSSRSRQLQQCRRASISVASRSVSRLFSREDEDRDQVGDDRSADRQKHRPSSSCRSKPLGDGDRRRSARRSRPSAAGSACAAGPSCRAVVPNSDGVRVGHHRVLLSASCHIFASSLIVRRAWAINADASRRRPI